MGKNTRALVAVVLVLLAVGIVVLASVSAVKGSATFDDPHYFLKRQVAWLALAIIAGALAARFDYHWWQKSVLPLAGFAILLLVLVIIPGIGTIVGGGRRWLRLGPLSLQPSELAKFVSIVVLSVWMSKVGRRAAYFKEGLLFPIAILGLFCGLMMLEPDFGTTILTGSVGMAIMFAGGTRISHLVTTGMLGLSAFMLAVMRDPVRLGRILAFIMPEKYPATAYHLAQSKLAFIRGGLSGVGLGNSIQKQFYLPEAHTDFILAIVGEELGFIVTLLVVALFLAILICGMFVSIKALEPFGRLLAFGITFMLCLQAAINIGVVTGCLPTKGLPLPFISYGGSSLVVSVASLGVLLNIAHHTALGSSHQHNRLIKDRGHRF
jgi:cell division protein FtsW